MASVSTTVTLSQAPSGGVLVPGGKATVHNAQIDSGSLAALQANMAQSFVGQIPTVGSYTYNSDGTVATDPDGNTYTYNSDGTVHAVTRGGTTRTATYNTDGSFGGWA